jgi:hypothetical protein
LLSEVMTLNRLICPLSEHATPDWLRRTAVGDILGTEFAPLTEDALYRNLDKLHPHREQIERELAAREQQLFHLDETIYLYDLTSTYFEGQVMRNRQAKRGYSRDKRPDCKQVLVGLVLDRDGFPKLMRFSRETARTAARSRTCSSGSKNAPARLLAPL